MIRLPTVRRALVRCGVATAVLATAAAPLAIPAPAAADVAPGRTAADAPLLRTVHFGYTGAETGFVVPAGVTELRVVATGARGGILDPERANPVTSGGRAARVTGVVAVTPGQQLWVRVGGQGSEPSGYPGGAGGWNGGGAGGRGSSRGGAGGGGGTDLRTCGAGATGCSPLSSRLVVAAGGGGSGAIHCGTCPDNAGPILGGDAGSAGADYSYGTRGLATGGAAGTATEGGAGGISTSQYDHVAHGTAGAFGVGATSPTMDGKFGSGGGGGGWYGGGSGAMNNYYGAGGGGGSSLVPAGGSLELVSRDVAAGLSITYAVGVLESLSVTLDDPSAMVATGTDRREVTVTARTDTGLPFPGLDLSLASSDPGQSFTAVVDHGDGTYGARLLGSTTPGTATVTATAAGSVPTADVAATLPVRTDGYTVTVRPLSGRLLATGQGSTEVSAEARTSAGRALPGLDLRFTSTDAGHRFGDVTSTAAGVYTATLAGSTTPGVAEIGVVVRGAGAPTIVPAALHTDPYAAPSVSVSSSAPTPARAGWYRTPVTVSFDCAGTLLLSDGCPAPVVLGEGRDQQVTRTVTDSLGAVATGSAGPISVDLTAPTLSVTGARRGATYLSVRTLACRAADALSGVESCTVTTTKKKVKESKKNKKGKAGTRATRVTWTATAVDRAGNTASSIGHYTIRPRRSGR